MRFANQIALALAPSPGHKIYRIGELFSGAGGMTLGAIIISEILFVKKFTLGTV